jgi:DNA mismatch repair ATPase MutL
MNAYQEMITKDAFPMYVLFIDLDPTQVDVNVHPTKQEIKFEDEKIIYAFVQAAVKHALAQFSVTPTLDFELDASIQQLSSIQQPFTEEKKSAATSGSIFKGFTEKNKAHFIEPTNRSELKHWRDFYESPRSTVDSQQPAVKGSEAEETSRTFNLQPSTFNTESLIQLHGQFILAQTPLVLFSLTSKQHMKELFMNDCRKRQKEKQLPHKEACFLLQLN